MKLGKCLILFLSVAPALVIANPAPESNKKQLLKNLYVAEKIDERFSGTFKPHAHALAKLIMSDHEEKKEFNPWLTMEYLEHELLDIMNNSYDYEKTIEKAQKIYDEHYTVEDIKNLLAFYNSETGKKAVAMSLKLRGLEGEALLESQVNMAPAAEKFVANFFNKLKDNA